VWPEVTIEGHVADVTAAIRTLSEARGVARR
jgi:hypothetical protein